MDSLTTPLDGSGGDVFFFFGKLPVLDLSSLTARTKVRYIFEACGG